MTNNENMNTNMEQENGMYGEGIPAEKEMPAKKPGTPIGIKVAGYVFAFILSLCIFVLTLSLICKYTLSTKALLACIPDNYYSSLCGDILEQAQDYTLPTGIDPSVLSDVFTAEQVEKDVKFCIMNSDPKNNNLDTSAMEAQILANVQNFFSSQDVEINEEEMGDLNEYGKEITDIYRRSVKLPGIDYIVRARDGFSQILVYVLIVTLLLGVASAILCLKLVPNSIRGVRYVTEAVGGAGLLTLIVPLVMLLNRFYEHLNISPAYFANAIAAYIRGALVKCVVAGAVMVLIYAAMTVYIFTRKKKK